MGEWLEKVKQGLQRLGEAIRKSSDAAGKWIDLQAEIGRRTARIRRLQGEREKLIRQIGEKVYTLHTRGKVRNRDVLEDCVRIDEILGEIERLRREIEELRRRMAGREKPLAEVKDEAPLVEEEAAADAGEAQVEGAQAEAAGAAGEESEQAGQEERAEEPAGDQGLVQPVIDLNIEPEEAETEEAKDKGEAEASEQGQ